MSPVSDPRGPEKRRRDILGLLRSSPEPLTGSELAERFGVSRQVIVQDVALLRAEGENVLATSRGYLIPQAPGGMQRFTLACQHGEGGVEEELLIMVGCGAKVLDVIVEHPIYGELRGLLMLQSREDVQRFLERLYANEARLLSALTGGVHLHTVEVLNSDVLELVKRRLRGKGYLVEG